VYPSRPTVRSSELGAVHEAVPLATVTAVHRKVEPVLKLIVWPAIGPTAPSVLVSVAVNTPPVVACWAVMEVVALFTVSVRADAALDP
jgi:hypothetical protein